MDDGVTTKVPLKLLAVAVASALGSAAAVGLINHPPSFSFGRSQGAGLSPSCNVLGLQIYGEIVSNSVAGQAAEPGVSPSTASSTSGAGYVASNMVEDTLRYSAQDQNIKALLVDIDSPGGGVVAGEEIAKAIHRFGKPSVAVIHEVGASSAYLAASAADVVFASQNSAVGSIGATESFLDYSEKDKKEGITFIQLSSGPFKDMSADKPFTQAERDLAMRDIMTLKDNFVKMVADYRHQTVEKVNALADGSTMLGRQAKESGLIDQIGGTQEALDYLEQKIGEPVNICWQ